MKSLLLVKTIYKTRNTRMGNRMRGTRGMFTRNPGNLLEDCGSLLEDSGEYCYFNILGNVKEDSGELSRRFREMLKKIPKNHGKDS